MNAEQNVVDAQPQAREPRARDDFERQAGQDNQPNQQARQQDSAQNSDDSAESGSSRNAAGEGGAEFDESGQRLSPGMGQSKSSRRRRRKRKNKGADAHPGQPGAASDGGDGGPDDSSQASGQFSEQDGNVASAVIPSMQGAGQNGAGNNSGNAQGGQRREGSHARTSGQNGSGPQQQGGAAPGGTKRWKKKFRERNGRPGADNLGNVASGSSSNGNGSSGGGQQVRDRDTHQPGNNAGGGFKRKGGFGGGQNGGQNGGGKGQSRGARGFVGPMDHSYRATNGNFADTPPSTMEQGNHGGGGRRSSYQGDSQPIDYSQGRHIPIPENTPTHIYFFIEDLFITAKIQETARKLGVKVAFVKNDKEAVAALTATVNLDRPSLIVFDLNNANAKPMTLIPKLKTKLKKTASIIGFLSHLQGDLKAKAVEAGCDTVMPRAAFSQNLPNLLRRYGIEDTEEANFNQ